MRIDPEERTLPLDKPFLLSAAERRDEGDRLLPRDAGRRRARAGRRSRPRARPRRPRRAPLPAGYGEPAEAGHARQAPRQPERRRAWRRPGGGGATLLKPKNADGPFILTAQRFEEFPNLWTAGPDFENLTKVSDANPQQAQYVWGRSELIDYLNADGKTLRAILTKPDNFDPAKKYPLMVYIYEELTNGLHSYVTPSPGTSINLARYVSNGYVLLQPDIVYTTGYPGEDALKCVVPAVQQRRRDGVHRPGARSASRATAGAATRSPTSSRAPTCSARSRPARRSSNMMSAYGGIRWGTGHVARLPVRALAEPHRRAAVDQDRCSSSRTRRIFWVEKVNTPYLTIHNDEDDAVPWYQGIEFFSALRRLGKEAYMFNFNTEKHGLRERENQKYWTIHLDEFFDHYLLGKPRPDVDGQGRAVPRAREAGRERVLQEEVGARGTV